MIEPFPLLPEGTITYREAQEQAARVDSWLGIQTECIEAGLRKEAGTQELWIGLPTQALLTPYSELREILHRLGPLAGETVVDLGAGYGRMGFVLSRHHPEVTFIGYEYVKERVEEGNRCLKIFGAASEVRLICADLLSPDVRPVSARYYFIYDFGSRAAIKKTLGDLKNIARTRKITVVGRGRGIRDSIEREEPWLSSVVPPEHRLQSSIYRSG